MVWNPGTSVYYYHERGDYMNIIKALRYFNSSDGPHISLEKLAAYCGVSKTAMRDYIIGKYKPTEEVRLRMEKGLTEMVQEMNSEWPI